MRVHESSGNLRFFLRHDRAERSGSEAQSRAPAVGHADHRRAGLEEGFHQRPFFLNAVFSFPFFVASPSAGVGCGHPSSSSYRCVNTKVEHKKTYAIAFGADGAGRLILITGGVSSAQGVTRARRRSENSWGGGVRAAGYPFISRPSFCGVVCWVWRRHQSTAKPRARATMSCLRRLELARGSWMRGASF